MRSASVRGLILGFVLVAGCKPDPHRPDGAPPWWKPAPGEAADWDIQLAASPFDISAPRAMYALYLWDVVPAATTLDYGDGTPLAVPAGVHASAIADLHAHTPPAIVVCQVGTGSIRLTDPDAKKFPGYEASPPNRPDPVAPDSVIGWSTTVADANERFINIHPDVRTKVRPLIEKRIELAQTIGCDAIEAKDNDELAYQFGVVKPGFTTTLERRDHESWVDVVTSHAHELRLSVGQRNGTGLSIDHDSLAHDWLVVERCSEDPPFCDQVQPYLNKHKAVFAIEYNTNEAGAPIDSVAGCKEVKNAGIETGIVKDNALSSAVYAPCQ